MPFNKILIAVLVTVLPGALIASLVLLRSHPDREAGYPNLILISIDTLRRDHLGLYGYQRNTTPNIDALAPESVVFDDAIAAHTNTSPAHASMLTGLYPMAHGIVRNLSRLAEGVTTLGQILTSRGFDTAAFVSGHTLNDTVCGLSRGFSVYDEPNTKIVDRRAGDTFRRVKEWLNRRPKERPFFLFFHLFDPHYPYDPPAPYDTIFGSGYRGPANGSLRYIYSLRGWVEPKITPAPADLQRLIDLYDGEIAYADHHLGRFFRLLKQLGYYDRSLIIVTSDHGETLAERPFAFDHGGRAFDEQIRIPLLIRFPEEKYGGRRIRGPVHQVDFLPAILDYLNLPEEKAAHGRSFLSQITANSRLPDRSLFSLARPEPERVPDLRSVMIKSGLVAAVRRTGKKLIGYPTADGMVFQLFNLKSDPGEKKNLAGRRLEVVEELAEEIRTWRGSMPDRGFAPRQKLPRELEKALRSIGYLK